MPYVHTTIIGGGQAGLALSRCLTARQIEHVVLERGTIAQSWRTERWTSLRLLTPNWMSRLPGWAYRGQDPDGFMTMPEVIDYLTRYARSFDAPVQAQTMVESVHRRAGRYRIDTNRGVLTSDNVVVATGACHVPRRPACSSRAHPSVSQLTAATYRRPEDLPSGRTLVVGASATGVQLAAELRTAGRDVIVAVGRHLRLPRTYRGRDIHWWLDRLGLLGKPLEEHAGTRHPVHQVSAQLVGSQERRNVDLDTLRRAGVDLVGRLVDIDGTRVRFAGNLHQDVGEADARLSRLLARIDDHIRDHPGEARGDHRGIHPVDAGDPVGELDLAAAGISTVVWATGYRRRYPWLHVPVLGSDGEIMHRHGVTPFAGLYALGLPGQSRVNSTFIDGVGADARFVAAHIAARAGIRAA